MVFYFYPRGFSGKEDYLIYMGKDKYENEDLIKHALPHDVWLHVDNLSSAHVYIRLPAPPPGAPPTPELTPDSIPPDTLEDAAQLVKANSIAGCKAAAVDVVYTPASNLRKGADMDTGTVGFHDERAVRKVRGVHRKPEVVKRLERSREERHPDLRAEREAWERESRAAAKAAARAAAGAARAAERDAREDARRAAELRSYATVMTEEALAGTRAAAAQYANAEEYEDDFM